MEKSCSKHRDQIEGKNLKDLAEELGNLRYDALEEFLRYFSEKIIKDSKADFKRKRYKLAEQLLECGLNLKKSEKNINKSWKISKPYMSEVKELRKISLIPKEELGLLNLGQRMKAYENEGRIYLDKKMPVMIRLDGRSFHSYTKGFERPFDEFLINAFKYTTLKLAEEISNFKFAYSQSDEITIFLNGFEHDSQGMWFEGNKSKIETISAALATAFFNDYMSENYWGCIVPKGMKKLGVFDSRAWNIPKEEVVNCFLWRQLDCEKNSVSMHASSLYSHKTLLNKNSDVKKQMIIEKGENWDELPNYKKYGFAVYKQDQEIEISTIPNEKFDFSKVFEKEGKKFINRKKWFVDNNIPRFVNDKEFLFSKFNL